MTARLRLAILLLCLVLALVLGVFSLSQNLLVRQRALAWVEQLLTEAVGREVQVEAVTIQPWAGRIDLSRLRVAREGTLAGGVLFSAETMRARWSWTALFRRQLVLRQVMLVRPRLTLVAEGAPGMAVRDVLPLLLQWQAVRVGGWTLRVDRASLREGQAAWAGADGTRGTLEGLEGELTWREGSDGVVSTAARLRALGLVLAHGDATRRFERISLQASGTADTVSIGAAEFSLAGAAVTARGSVADPGGAPRLDLVLGIQAPLRALFSALGSDRQVEGTVVADGRLQGPWEQAVFRGEGSLQFGNGQAPGAPLRFSMVWEGDRLEAKTTGGPPTPGESFHGTFSLHPDSGAYRIRAGLSNTNLGALSGLPSAAAALVGVQLPREVRGRLIGEVDVVGRGTDFSTLRGRADLRVDGLALEGETPAGSLEARVVATASGLRVEAFSLRTAGGRIRGRGALSFLSGKLDLPVQADLGDVAAFGRGFGLPFVSGKATLKGRVVGSRFAPRLAGRITWREARIAGHSVDLVEGEVEIGRRLLKMSRLALRAGRTRAILRGSVEATGTTPLRRLNPKRDLALDLQGQLNPARTADLIGLLPNDLEIQGVFRASGRLHGTLEALSGDLEVTFGNVRTWKESWQRGEALFRFRPGAVDITRISLRRGPEQLSGEIGVEAGGALRGRLTSTSMDVAKVGSLSDSLLAGRATFLLDLQGTLGDTVTLGQATATALSYRDIPLGPGTATFKVERKAVEVDLAFRRGTHRLRVNVGPPSDRSVRGELTLTGADLDLVLRAGEMETLRSWLPRASGRIRFQGPAGAPPFGAGEAEFASFWVRLGGESWESRGPVRAGWSGSTFEVQRLRLGSGQREFEIQGTLGGGGRADLLVKGQLPLTVVAGFLPVVRPAEGLANVDVRLRGHRDSLETQGTLEIQQGRASVSGIPAEFREVQAALDLQGDRTQIRRWQAKLAEGSFRADGEVRRRGEEWRLQLNFEEEDGRAEQLLAGLYKGKGEVTGALSLGGVLTSGGEDGSDFWRNLEGSLTLGMRDGRIGRYTSVAKLLALLNVGQLLELKGPELAADGMPYQRLTANFKIQRGMARTENLVLDSAAMKVNAVGSINLVDDTVDLTVAVKPFQNVDHIITNIPIAGWLLGGKERSLLVAYFRVTGPLADPEVEAIPLWSVGRSVFGIFKNLLEIPEVLTGPYEDLPPQQIKPDEGKGR